MSAVSTVPLTPQPSGTAGTSRGWDAPRAGGSLAPAPYPPRVSASVLSVRSVSLCSAGLLQATWCLSPWTLEKGPGPPPRQARIRREGRVGWTGLEEIKDTQKLPGPVPLVIPQSLGSRGGLQEAQQGHHPGPREAPFFSISLQC